MRLSTNILRYLPVRAAHMAKKLVQCRRSWVAPPWASSWAKEFICSSRHHASAISLGYSLVATPLDGYNIRTLPWVPECPGNYTHSYR